MKHFVPAAVVCLVLLPAALARASEEPFKLGTFEHEDEEIIGVVLRDRYVVDLARANAALERRRPLWVKLPMPEDMAELAGRYEYGMRERIHGIVDAVLPAIDADENVLFLHTGGAPALYAYMAELREPRNGGAES